jgi:hypothetical protein
MVSFTSTASARWRKPNERRFLNQQQWRHGSEQKQPGTANGDTYGLKQGIATKPK